MEKHHGLRKKLFRYLGLGTCERWCLPLPGRAHRPLTGIFDLPVLKSLCSSVVRPQRLKAYSHWKFLLQFRPLLAASPFTQLVARSPASDLQWHFIYSVPGALVTFAFSLCTVLPGRMGYCLLNLCTSCRCL